jgi:hypothetical protein
MGMTEARPYRVTAPSGAEVEVLAHGPHQAGVEAATALGVNGLIAYPTRHDGALPRWWIRWVGWDYPCWLLVVR